MKESSIFCVWNSESEQVLESHNCFVNESITAYKNIANIEVHSKKETTSTSNHAVDSSSAFSFLLLQLSFVSEGVFASATLLLQFLLLQQSNSVSMHSSSSFVLEEAFTSSHCQSELMSSDSRVLDKLSDLDELGSLNPSASAASCYNLHDCSVVNESDGHVSYVYAAISIDDIVKSTTYKQAVKLPLCDKWKMAMKDEIQSLKDNNTWDIVNVLSNQHVLKGHWVYKVKRDAHDQVSHYKACWVVKGYEQQFDIDYDQTFASVVKLQTYKTLFTLTAHYDLEVNQMNVTIVFLYGSIDQVVYIELSHSYGLLDKVALLNKALYGLKQAPHLWYKTLHDLLMSLGFCWLDSDHSMFIWNSVIIIIYVDDFLLVEKNKSAIQDVKQCLNNTFKMSDLGPVFYYLDMKVKWNCTECTICLTQTAYINKVLQTFQQLQAVSVDTFMNFNAVLMKESTTQADITVIWQYQKAVRSLMYIMLQTHSDITFAVSTVSQFAQNLNTLHYNVVKWIFKYLVNTMNLDVIYDITDDNLISYIDADWGGCHNIRKFTEAYLFLLYEGLINWCFKCQQSVALFLMKAEYMIKMQAMKKAIWLRCFLSEIGYFHDNNVIVIQANNNKAMNLARNPEFHACIKHINIQYHFVCEAVDCHLVDFEFVPIIKQAADGLTKALFAVKFSCFLIQSGFIFN